MFGCVWERKEGGRREIVRVCGKEGGSTEGNCTSVRERRREDLDECLAVCVR